MANLLLSNSSELLLERLRFEYPAFLEDNQEVFHVIRVRLFVELLLKLSAGDINIFPKVYNVGQQLEAKEHAYGRTVEKITQDALAMIAYRDPHESPSAYLLSETSRQEAAGVLEDALLKHDGLSECTPLERLLKAFITDVEYLKESGSIEVALTESVPSLVLKDAIKQD